MEAQNSEERFTELPSSGQPQPYDEIKARDDTLNDDAQFTCFTEDLHDGILHFQIIRFSKQIYVWIGCNSSKFGHLYAAASTRPNNTASVTSLLRGNADNVGSSMARRIVLKTGLSVVFACNIPKDSPILEAAAERKLFEKLASLGYIRMKSFATL